MKKQSSGTDLQRIDAMRDADIDTSDIPPIGEDFFRKATVRKPEKNTRSRLEAAPTNDISADARSKYKMT
ncbi:MAG: hypothetical protein P4L55_10315 [Syntrophobacteraceae bacterium]|nr:hypothetical protein [Syntrophobacteraceae bacterium]